MDYISLANKYRPRLLQDIVGQDVLVKTLSSAIASGNIASAILLCGPYGTGKTTTARIIASYVNCLDKRDGNPCLVCKSCTSIQSFCHPDVLEIDAASHTGVEDIRNLIENSAYAPVMSKYKIYIIDEVHMLSNSAFNALLKTLEEPRPHVKFFLATTELSKVLPTVISRCQNFQLARPNASAIQNRLKKIAELENIKAQDSAIDFIAQNSNGSVRDAIFILEQAISLAQKDEITENTARDCLGFLSQSDCQKFTDCILSGECAEALELFEKFYSNGYEPISVLYDLLSMLHKKIKGLAFGHIKQNLSIEFCSRVAKCLINGIEEVSNLHNQFEAAEILIIRLCYLSQLPSTEKILQSNTDKQQESTWKQDKSDDTVKCTGSDALVNKILKEFKGSSLI